MQWPPPLHPTSSGTQQTSIQRQGTAGAAPTLHAQRSLCFQELSPASHVFLFAIKENKGDAKPQFFKDDANQAGPSLASKGSRLPPNRSDKHLSGAVWGARCCLGAEVRVNDLSRSPTASVLRFGVFCVSSSSWCLSLSAWPETPL